MGPKWRIAVVISNSLSYFSTDSHVEAMVRALGLGLRDQSPTYLLDNGRASTIRFILSLLVLATTVVCMET